MNLVMSRTTTGADCGQPQVSDGKHSSAPEQWDRWKHGQPGPDRDVPATKLAKAELETWNKVLCVLVLLSESKKATQGLEV